MRLRAARACPRIPLPFPRRFPRCVSIIQEAAGNCKHFHHFSIQKIGHFQIKSVFFEQQTAVPVIHAKPPKKCGCNGFVTFLFPFFNPIGCDFRISPSFPNSVSPPRLQPDSCPKKFTIPGRFFRAKRGGIDQGGPSPAAAGIKVSPAFSKAAGVQGTASPAAPAGAEPPEGRGTQPRASPPPESACFSARLRARRARKNARSCSAHSSPSTPATTSGRWL